MNKPRAAISWSGGKDSCLAFHRAAPQFDVAALITMFTEDGARSRSHGLRPEIFERQAELLGVELVPGYGSWQSYEEEFIRLLRTLPARDISHVIFGDILFPEHRGWVERVCREAGLQAVEPLWRESTSELVREFIRVGGQALIVAAKAAVLDESWLGRKLDPAMFPEFERLGVDPCGENGEYHTLVISFPAFSSPLRIREVARLLHDGYRMLDLTLEKTASEIL